MQETLGGGEGFIILMTGVIHILKRDRRTTAWEGITVMTEVTGTQNGTMIFQTANAMMKPGSGRTGCGRAILKMKI